MKIALTVREQRISPVLDTARTFLVVELQQGVVVSRQEKEIAGGTVQNLLSQLEALGVRQLVCGAVSRRFADWLSAAGIQLIPFISGDVEEILAAVLAGTVCSGAFAMPGCGSGGRRCGAGKGQGYGRGKPGFSGGHSVCPECGCRLPNCRRHPESAVCPGCNRPFGHE
ncbi:MAG TPA: NifB/NifX family molybdenum-iron cluster-binding protein [Candidatus Hydrogenedentes bacterium]|jgi:predicted Fe-Mo cluster-binding NifX family protein|nr:MAG: Dinitrogenase iron-molybdenum cofactor [Candidatus Hydrogenedentes bacterium ADurb.Bin170]HOD95196.1 NifB/NifX family molybdenum-iron cluster-binding protein [Candidatus Hydrogenedentota bacterium]HOM47183.1 NifB/NifX family molybdenum-iron cluster-binding protein [Candidatus Hydrogenedentota bacterium]HOR50543.1 NifB/NifX family molybdenum-iron cluster-binding protein [Candidatus Hydrogenedentota bacterium]HPK24520.1 NifB/NifX family molybdenum-iron cluster-binding protein [Candidatus 